MPSCAVCAVCCVRSVNVLAGMCMKSLNYVTTIFYFARAKGREGLHECTRFSKWLHKHEKQVRVLLVKMVTLPGPISHPFARIHTRTHFCHQNLVGKFNLTLSFLANAYRAQHPLTPNIHYKFNVRKFLIQFCV